MLQRPHHGQTNFPVQYSVNTLASRRRASLCVCGYICTYIQNCELGVVLLCCTRTPLRYFISLGCLTLQHRLAKRNMLMTRHINRSLCNIAKLGFQASGTVLIADVTLCSISVAWCAFIQNIYVPGCIHKDWCWIAGEAPDISVKQ